jgi:hypothetical protein
MITLIFLYAIGQGWLIATGLLAAVSGLALYILTSEGYWIKKWFKRTLISINTVSIGLFLVLFLHLFNVINLYNLRLPVFSTPKFANETTTTKNDDDNVDIQGNEAQKAEKLIVYIEQIRTQSLLPQIQDLKKSKPTKQRNKFAIDSTCIQLETVNYLLIVRRNMLQDQLQTAAKTPAVGVLVADNANEFKRNVDSLVAMHQLKIAH